MAGDGRPLDDGELCGLAFERTGPGLVYMLKDNGTLEFSKASLSSWARLRDVDLARCAAEYFE